MPRNNCNQLTRQRFQAFRVPMCDNVMRMSINRSWQLLHILACPIRSRYSNHYTDTGAADYRYCDSLSLVAIAIAQVACRTSGTVLLTRPFVHTSVRTFRQLWNTTSPVDVPITCPFGHCLHVASCHPCPNLSVAAALCQQSQLPKCQRRGQREYSEQCAQSPDVSYECSIQMKTPPSLELQLIR